MPYTCEQIEERIIDYLDGQLDEKQRQQVDDHLKACTTCAEDLAMQKLWLDQTVPQIRNNPERFASGNLHLKIMEAVKQAAETEKNEAADEKNDENQPLIILPWYRRFTTRNVLTTAAALVVLVISIQVFSGLYQSTVRSGDPADNELIGDLAIDGEAGSLEYAEELPFDSDQDELIDGDIGIMGDDDALINDSDEGIESSMPAVIDNGREDRLPELDLFELDWQVYTGFLADLPVGGSLFSQGEPKITEPADTTSETDETDLIAPDDPDADTTDKPLRPMNFMEQAEAIRVLIREGPPAETLLMTFWDNSDASEAWKNLYMMSQTWTYRSAVYQMPAAKAQEQLREELGAALSDEVFADIDLNRWEIILIRIGE